MRCISLYSGADNLGDGVIQAGHEIILCVEMDKDCCETIKLNHPDIEVLNMKVSDALSTLPKADCIIGGPPCPEFSRAKSNRTFDLCEVNNFIKAREITGAKHHFMENVQDLGQVHKERNFIVNCADYGVPQTRIRRIFTDLELPKPTHSKFPCNTLFDNPLKKWVSVKDALGLDGIIEDNLAHTQVTDSRDFFISNTGYSTQNRLNITRSISEPSDTIVCGASMQITDYPVMSTKYPKYRKLQDVKDKDQTEYVTDGVYARKLTNEELAILQGFRKDFKFFGGKTSVRRQIGNALPSAVSNAFFKNYLFGFHS